MQKLKMKSLFALAVGVFALAATVVAFTACNGKKPEEKTTLVVACEASLPPYAYADPVTGEIIGADIDLVREIASRMGCSVRFITLPFQHLIPVVAQDKADMAISSISITEDREQKVLFSDAYDTLTYKLIVPKNSQVTSLSTITTQRVAVKDGTRQAAETKAIAKNANITYFLTDQQVLSSYLKRNAEVAVMNGKRVDVFAGTNADYKLVDAGIPEEKIGIVFNLKNKSMKEDVDEILKQLEKANFYTESLKKHNKPVTDSTLQKQEKIIVAAIDSRYPPFVFQREGKLVGLDLDIARRIATKMGCTLVLKQDTIEKNIEYVASGKADFAFSGLSATEDRRGRMIFSLPYADGKKVLIARTEDKDTDYTELLEKRFGVVTGSSNEDLMKILSIQPKNITHYVSSNAMVNALLENKVDVILDDSVAANIYCDRYIGKLEQIQEFPEVEDYVFLIAPGREDIKKAADEVIQEMNLNQELLKLFHDYEMKYITSPTEMVTY